MDFLMTYWGTHLQHTGLIAWRAPYSSAEEYTDILELTLIVCLSL